MDSNWCSDNLPEGLMALAADVDDLAAQDLDGLPEAVRAQRVLALRWLLDRLEGQWLNELAGVDACGAAGAEQGIQFASTASWLGTACAWAPVPPPAPFAPPGRCSVAP